MTKDDAINLLAHKLDESNKILSVCEEADKSATAKMFLRKIIQDNKTVAELALQTLGDK